MTAKIFFSTYSRALKLPSEKKMREDLLLALGRRLTSGDIHIDFVSREKMQKLNKEYRQKDYPTNVLSFENTLPLPPGEKFLGNLILCPQVIRSEAKAQRKSFDHHLMHLLIHGTLHLLGFDHEKAKDAKEMESLEIKLLKKIGIPNPYE